MRGYVAFGNLEQITNMDRQNKSTKIVATCPTLTICGSREFENISSRAARCKHIRKTWISKIGKWPIRMLASATYYQCNQCLRGRNISGTRIWMNQNTLRRLEVEVDWESKRLKSAFMAATYIVGPSSSVAATAVLTTRTSRCPALPHLPPRLSSPSFRTSLKHSSGTKSFFFFNYFLLCAVKNSWKQCGILYGTGSCISSVRVGGL